MRQIQTEEVHVAFAALLQDLLALRASAGKLWRDNYVLGSLAASAASAVAVAANTAIDLARRLENDVEPLLNSVGGVGELLTRHYRTAVAAERMTTPSDADELGVQTYAIAKGCMFEAYYLMEQFRQQCRRAGKGEVPPVYDGRYGWFDGEGARSVKSNLGMFNRDRAGLFEVLSETAILVQKVEWNQPEDELTRSVRLMLENPDAPLSLWTVFAAQLFIDNLEIIGPMLDRMCTETGNVSRTIAGSIRESLKQIHGRPRPVGWSTKKDRLLRRLEQDSMFLETPVLAKWKRRLSPDLDRSRTESVLPRRNALFSGVRAHHLGTTFHTVGIAYANAWGAIFTMNHLYAAGRRRSFLESGNAVPFLWPDMLFVQQLQGEDKRFWVGPPPEDMTDFWKQRRLCHGASLAELAREPDGPELGAASTATQRPRRGLVELAPASLLFRGRLGGDTVGKARIEMSLDDVRRILGDCEWTIMTSTPDGVGMMRDPDTSANRRFGAADSERRPRPGAQQNQQRDLTPAKLVDALAYALSAERVELLFDYFFANQYLLAVARSHQGAR